LDETGAGALGLGIGLGLWDGEPSSAKLICDTPSDIGAGTWVVLGDLMVVMVVVAMMLLDRDKFCPTSIVARFSHCDWSPGSVDVVISGKFWGTCSDELAERLRCKRSESRSFGE